MSILLFIICLILFYIFMRNVEDSRGLVLAISFVGAIFCAIGAYGAVHA